MFKELKEPCKSLIAKNKCLGCNRLEDPNFTGDKNCKYAKENIWFTNLKLISD